MADIENRNAQKRQHHKERLSQKACRFAETLIKNDIGRDTLAEVVEHQWLWTEFRVVFKQFMNVWQDLTVSTLALDTIGETVGWHVEKHKDASGPPILSDMDIEKIARELRQIRPDMRCLAIERPTIDDKRSFAIARFAGQTPDASLDVAINHTTGEVIGVLPTTKGKTSPIPTDDAGAKKAQELAWKHLEDDLKNRVGPDVLEQARSLIKLTPLTATRDELGRRLYRYRVWTMFSTCDVSIEDESGEIVAWYVEAFQAEAPELRLTETAAKEFAKSELRTTEGVQGPTSTFGRMADQAKATVHWWHAEEGVGIEGDHTTVLLNGWNGKVFSVARKWRSISKDLLKAPGISAEEALYAANRAISRGSSAPPGSIIGKSVIQVAADPDQPSPVRDVLVWKIGYRDSKSPGFTEVAIDHRTGEPVRVTGW